MSISVIIGTRNSARHLDRVLASVKNFDEVVVCDMESSDETRRIAQEHGVKVVHVASLENSGHEGIREYVLTQAKERWVLVLRPDEVVTPHLREYLYDFVSDPGEYHGLIIPRKNYVLNRLRDHSYPDYQLRFFDREVTTWNTNIGADPKIDGKVQKIPAPRGELALIKLPRSVASLLTILNRRTSEQREAVATARKLNVWNMFWVPVSKFLKEYFLKGKFRYGVEGYLTSVNKALHLYCAMAKAHEDKAMGSFYKFIDDIIEGKEQPIIPTIVRRGVENDEHHGFNDYHLHTEHFDHEAISSRKEK